MVRTVTTTRPSMRIEAMDVPDGDKDRLFLFDSIYGDGDTAIDIFEYARLAQGGGHALISRPSESTLTKIRTAFLTEAGADDFTITSDTVAFHRKHRRGTSESTLSFHYDYSEGVEGGRTVKVALHVADTGAVFEEGFEANDPLPERPEDFALVTSGLMAQARAEGRRLWIWDVSTDRRLMARVQRILDKSHPRLVGRFLQELIAYREHEDQETRKRAVSIFTALASRLSGSRSPSELLRAARVMAAIPGLPGQALFALNLWLPERRLPDAFGRFLEPRQRRNVESLLESLVVNEASSLSDDSILVPPDLKQALPMIRFLAAAKAQMGDVFSSLAKIDDDNGRITDLENEFSVATKGPYFVATCSPLRGWDVLADAEGIQAYPPVQTKPRDFLDEEEIFRRTLMALSDRTSVPSQGLQPDLLWRGTWLREESADGSPVAALSSSLRWEGGTLEGNWEVWISDPSDQGRVDPLRVDLDHKIHDLVRQGFIVVPSREQGSPTLAFKPESLLTQGPLPLPLTGGMILVEDPDRKEIRWSQVDEHGFITSHHESSYLGQRRFLGRNGDCFAYEEIETDE